MKETQLHECECGTVGRFEVCPDCEKTMFPLWSVHTILGRCVGQVVGCSARDAITTIQQTPEFDSYKALQPRPAQCDKVTCSKCENL